MKKKIYNLFLFALHFLIYFSCYFKSPKFCAYLIKISLIQPRIFKNRLKNKKTIIVLDRVIGGRRDIEIMKKSSQINFKILFMRRSITKIIFTYFCYKKKIFFNYQKPRPTKKDFLNQKYKNRKKHEQFWTDVIFNLKNYFNEKELNFISFAYYYFVENGLYAGCKNNKIPLKLWNKECFMSDEDVKYRMKIKEYKYVFKYFYKISVYNSFMRKMLIGMDKSNEKKITVNGCPRILDFIDKKKKYKKVNNLLFLSFNPRQGFPEHRDYKNLNWNLSYNKVIKILNDLSKNKNINITIKRKKFGAYKTPHIIDKRIKIFEGGTAEKFINKADIVIGHNSGSTVESLINGKYVMIPFFEKNPKLKKYLFKFNKDIIYTSEEKMKKDILNLVSKRVLFPLNVKKNEKTTQYYYGKPKNVVKNYVNFLNS